MQIRITRQKTLDTGAVTYRLHAELRRPGETVDPNAVIINGPLVDVLNLAHDAKIPISNLQEALHKVAEMYDAEFKNMIRGKNDEPIQTGTGR